MNTPSPLVPQGSIPPSTKGQSNVRLVVFGIIALHAVFFGGLLIQGCKPKEEKPPAPEQTKTLPPITTPEPMPVAAAPTSATPAVVSAPVPAVTPMPAPDGVSAGTPKEYVVSKGDNFTTIGKKFGVTAAAIAKANPSVDSAKLKIGQKLTLPGAEAATSAAAKTGAAADAGASDVYVVKSGDTLGKIAKDHATTIKALRDANSLKTDRITVGQKLKLPAGKTAAAGDAAAPAPMPVAAPAAPKP